MSGLSTHVLDLTAGAPAADVRVNLFHRVAGETLPFSEHRTDGDGRARLLDDDRFEAGDYRLTFEVGAYFRRTGAVTETPSFLEVVVIDFTVTDPARHYHVPLLVSPFGYSTYRGS